MSLKENYKIILEKEMGFFRVEIEADAMNGNVRGFAFGCGKRD
jgi:hypothetical protein